MEELEYYLLENWFYMKSYIKIPINLSLVKDSKYYYCFLIINGDLNKLKEYKGEYNFISVWGHNEYFLAVYFNRLEIIKYLNENTSLNINHIHKNGNNIYLFAIYNNRLEIMKYLEQNTNINIHHINSNGKNAYQIAKSNIDSDTTIKYLEENYYNTDGTLKVDLFKKYLLEDWQKLNENIQLIDKEYQPYLEIIKGNIDYFRKNKPKLDLITNKGDNAFLLAFYFHHRELAELLAREYNFDTSYNKINDSNNAYFVKTFENDKEMVVITQ